MTNEETALADKLLKEATDAKNPIQRRERIEDYNALVRAADTRRSAMEAWTSAMMATGIRALAE